MVVLVISSKNANKNFNQFVSFTAASATQESSPNSGEKASSTNSLFHLYSVHC